MPNERILAIAKSELMLELDGVKEPWLWDRAQRVLRSARGLAESLRTVEAQIERDALETAALFHATGWSEQVRAGQVQRWQLLARPTNDVQRELAASILQEKAAHLLPARILRIACDAIRQSSAKDTQVPEARLLGDAIALDEMGAIYIVQQMRNYAAEGRDLAQFVETWKRQQEYRYWELRLQNGFRCDVSRDLARRRLHAVQQFAESLGSEISNEPASRDSQRGPSGS